jgi:hypothetical protein
MTRDRRDAWEFAYTGVDSRRYRVLFEPRDAGGWDRIEYRKTDAGWEPIGREIVSDLDVTPGAEIVA